MPITRIFWSGSSNQDIHVLRGQTSRDLTMTGLRFFDDQHPDGSSTARDYLDNNNDVTLTFQPGFKGALGIGGVFSGLDIEVDMDTGEVTPGPAAGRNNFIIVATASDAVTKKVISTAKIRVHIHRSVQTFGLTPEVLTIRPAAGTRTESEGTEYRFTVRARFDDGTMGDLTTRHGVTWSSNPSGRVDSSSGGIIVGTSDSFDDHIAITAMLPAALGGGLQTGLVRIGRAWADDPDMPTTSIVVGGGWPGTTLPDKAPNVLFLSDGFTDERPFERAVLSTVHHLKHDRLLRPFDLLCTSMNFWRAFVPANTSGISVRCEIYPIQSNIGRLVPPATKPTDDDWEISQLIYAVGLPVPADAGIADLPAHWAGLVGTDTPLPADGIDPDVIDEWKRIAKRTFIEELDNFPGMALGEPPAADTDTSTPFLQLHPDRCGRDGLNVFLKLLQSVSGVKFSNDLNIGTVWATRSRDDDTDYEVGDLMVVADNPGRVFSCTAAGTTATDEPDAVKNAADGVTVADGTATFKTIPLWFDNASFLVMLSAFQAGRFRNMTRDDTRIPYIAASMRRGNADIPIAPPTGAMGFSLNFGNLASDDVSLQTVRGMAHEIAHSFGLGDEYVNSWTESPFSEAELSGSVNLQAEDDAKNASDNIDGEQIRWNWHRIRKAAVVTGAPSGTGPTFVIPVVPGHGLQFADGDTVLLRLRRPGGRLDKAAFILPGAGRSVPLQVVKPIVTDSVNVQAGTGLNVTLPDLQKFTPGSVLYLPVTPPTSVLSATYPFAEMVAKNVKDLISHNHDVLYHQPAQSAVTDDISNNEEIQHPDLDGLTPPLPEHFNGKDASRIVGLYEGGHQFANGIFHPTGTCVMRNSRDGSIEFCAVCRYIMVDFVDPFRHFEIDLDYDAIYPLK